MKKTIFLFLIIHFTLIVVDSLSQWQPDYRLTNSSANATLSSYNNVWSVASSGSVVHVVCMDFRNGNQEIYYKRSTDEGLSWGADTRLTNNASASLYPAVAVSGSVVHVIWADNRDGNYEIYYKRSTDGGVNWETDTRLTNNSLISLSPSVSVSGSVVHVVWYDERDGNREIYYKRSTDGGVNWEADTRLTNDPNVSYFPSSAVSGSTVHVVWSDDRDFGGFQSEIYYKRSTDGGATWGADTRLTNNPSGSEIPSVSVSGSVVHVVWRDSRDGNAEIYYKRSTDAGVTWGADTRLTNEPAFSRVPSVAVSGSVVNVVWSDERDGSFGEIYYKRSTDGGVSWGADTRLTDDPEYSLNPSVSVSGSVIHVVWADRRDGHYEIYYKRDPTGNVVGLTSINSEIPNQFSLSQNYPNPFNPTTKIRFALPKNAFTMIVIYDALGREVETLVSEQLNAGTYEAGWDASNYPSEIYYYQLKSGEISETRKAILIK